MLRYRLDRHPCMAMQYHVYYYKHSIATTLFYFCMQAELVSSVEQLIPKKILPASVCQWFTVKTEKTVTLNHKFRNVLEELRWKFWGDIHYSTADLFASSQVI